MKYSAFVKKSFAQNPGITFVEIGKQWAVYKAANGNKSSKSKSKRASKSKSKKASKSKRASKSNRRKTRTSKR